MPDKIYPQIMLTEEGYFMPFNQQAIDFTAKRKSGDIVEVELYKVRSPELNARFHIMVTGLWEQLPEKYNLHFPSINHLRYFLTEQAGYFEEYINPKTGEVSRRAESIKFRSMGEEKFKELFARVVEVIDDLIPILYGDLDDDHREIIMETILGIKNEFAQA